MFLPDAEELRDQRTGLPLPTLESQVPVCEFDVLAFSITFEPDELILVRMLELARIPLLARDRGESHPLVVAGAQLQFLNPEPMAPFLDVVTIGEAEALLPTHPDPPQPAFARRASRVSRRRGRVLPPSGRAGYNYLSKRSFEVERISFASTRAGDPQIFTVNRDGSNIRQLTFEGTYATPSGGPAPR